MKRKINRSKCLGIMVDMNINHMTFHKIRTDFGTIVVGLVQSFRATKFTILRFTSMIIFNWRSECLVSGTLSFALISVNFAVSLIVFKIDSSRISWMFFPREYFWVISKHGDTLDKQSLCLYSLFNAQGVPYFHCLRQGGWNIYALYRDRQELKLKLHSTAFSFVWIFTGN